MKQLSETVPNMPVVLIVGPAKSGKTTFICRLKWADKKTYIIDVDKNLAGPKKVLTKEGIDFNHVVFDHVDIDDNDNPLWTKPTGTASAPPPPYFRRLGTFLDRAKADATIGIIAMTSTTSMVQLIMDEVRIQLGKPFGSEFKGFDMWGKFAELWKHLMASCRTMGKPVFFDGHQQVDKGDMDQVLRYALAIPGQTGDLLPIQLTDMWLAEVKQEIVNNATVDKYWLQTVQTNVNQNLGTSLDLPRRFEATQEMADQIIKQLLPV